MKKEVIVRLHASFEELVQTDETGGEYWLARDLQELLGYTKWENFAKVIERAKTACRGSGYDDADHFLDVRKMVELGSGATRAVEDIALTRYACYLIAQNGDSSKEAMAFAQTYFAIQTRKQELIEQRLAFFPPSRSRRKTSPTKSPTSTSSATGCTVRWALPTSMCATVAMCVTCWCSAASSRKPCRQPKTSRRSSGACSRRPRNCPPRRSPDAKPGHAAPQLEQPVRGVGAKGAKPPPPVGAPPASAWRGRSGRLRRTAPTRPCRSRCRRRRCALAGRSTRPSAGAAG